MAKHKLNTFFKPVPPPSIDNFGNDTYFYKYYFSPNILTLEREIARKFCFDNNIHIRTYGESCSVIGACLKLGEIFAHGSRRSLFYVTEFAARSRIDENVGISMPTVSTLDCFLDNLPLY